MRQRLTAMLSLCSTRLRRAVALRYAQFAPTRPGRCSSAWSLSVTGVCPPSLPALSPTNPNLSQHPARPAAPPRLAPPPPCLARLAWPAAVHRPPSLARRFALPRPRLLTGLRGEEPCRCPGHPAWIAQVCCRTSSRLLFCPALQLACLTHLATPAPPASSLPGAQPACAALGELCYKQWGAPSI